MSRNAVTSARPLRSAVFAAACVGLAAAAHVLAGGRPPGPIVLVAAALAVAVLVTPLAGRLRSGPTVVTSMAVVQLGLHLAFSQYAAGGAGTQSHAATGLTPSMPGMGGMGGPGDRAADAHYVIAMTAAHLTVALLAARLLRRCDDAVSIMMTLAAALASAAVAAAGRLATRWARPAAPVRGLQRSARLARAIARDRAPRPPSTRWRTAVVRRGPPVAMAV